mmetsp:Transcript_17322/g.51997  ORF Transcript_17322/g.51997 Transcript_17322/m.51997 type:complete len:339 (+) Transcript_17322:342-1358(+)
MTRKQRQRCGGISRDPCTGQQPLARRQSAPASVQSATAAVAPKPRRRPRHSATVVATGRSRARARGAAHAQRRRRSLRPGGVLLRGEPPRRHEGVEIHIGPGIAVGDVVVFFVNIHDVLHRVGEVGIHRRAAAVLVVPLVEGVAVEHRVEGVVHKHREPVPDAGTAEEEAQEADCHGIRDVVGVVRILQIVHRHQEQVAERRADHANGRGARDSDDLQALALLNLLVAGRSRSDDLQDIRRRLPVVVRADDDISVGILGESVGRPFSKKCRRELHEDHQDQEDHDGPRRGNRRSNKRRRKDLEDREADEGDGAHEEPGVPVHCLPIFGFFGSRLTARR